MLMLVSLQNSGLNQITLLFLFFPRLFEWLLLVSPTLMILQVLLLLLLPLSRRSLGSHTWVYLGIRCLWGLHHIRDAFNKFTDLFLYRDLELSKTLENSLCYCYKSYEKTDRFYDLRFKWTAKAGIEYTLLKPDCHSWSISKMRSGREDTLEKRYAIKSYSKLVKNATETRGMFQTAFGASFLNRASVFELHKRFKEGKESVRDDERCGKSKEVNSPELISKRVRVRVIMLRF